MKSGRQYADKHSASVNALTGDLLEKTVRNDPTNPNPHMDELNKIKELLAPIFKETKTQKTIVFGSLAKNSMSKKSDLDLIIIKETDKRFFQRFDQYEKIHSLIPDRPVDMLIYTPNELSQIAHRPFIKQILAEGKVIYES